MGRNKFQQVDFETLEDFFDYLPSSELKIVQALRQLILECIPDCEEKLSYNVPTYYRHSRICFIWPSSVPWGNVKAKGVRLGFNYGYKMNDAIHYLDKGDRKQVYWKDFYEPEDIDIDLLKSYIFEAAIIDETLKKKK